MGGGGVICRPPPMKTTKWLIGAISIAAAAAAVRAGAQSLPATLIEISPAVLVNGTVDDGSFVQDYTSGVMRFTDFEAFCVEPIEGISYGDTPVYQRQDPATLVNSAAVSRLVGAYLDSARTPEIAGAIQWAIWETTTETKLGASLLDGNVRITTPDDQATADLANQYLANIDNFAPVEIVYLTNQGRQDVVTWNLIPEPSTAGLAALSLLVCLRRRR